MRVDKTLLFILLMTTPLFLQKGKTLKTKTISYGFSISTLSEPITHQLTISISINLTLNSTPFCSSNLANSFLPLQPVRNFSDEHKKVAKKVKSKEYYSTVMLSKKMFTRLSFSWFSKKSSKDVEISSLLKKLAKAYGNGPTSASPAKSFGSVPISSAGEKGVKRIKVIITKQQLQELLSKEIQLEDVLTSGIPATLLSYSNTSDKWKPELESIPEGNEL